MENGFPTRRQMASMISLKSHYHGNSVAYWPYFGWVTVAAAAARYEGNRFTEGAWMDSVLMRIISAECRVLIYKDVGVGRFFYFFLKQNSIIKSRR